MSEPTRFEPTDGGGARPDFCGGALLRVDRETLAEMRDNGVRFASVQAHASPDRLDARVACEDEIEIRNGVRYGLCASCSRLESDMRRALRSRQGAR